MKIKSISVAGIVLVMSSVASAQQSPREVGTGRQQWVVSVVHTIELNKLVDKLRSQQDVKSVGIAGSAPRKVYNVVTGLVIDDLGHVITRLPNLDPLDKHPTISIATSEGTTVPAQLVGIDCPSGFAILKVESLKTPLPDVAPPSTVSTGMPVKIVSAGFQQRVLTIRGAGEVRIMPSFTVMDGRVGAGSILSRARGAMTLRSSGLLSGNDGSVVTTYGDKLVGMAQYAGYGRAYLYSIDYLQNTVARRVLEHGETVPAGWLGARGDSLVDAPDVAAAGLSPRAGVVIREVNPDSPAATSGIRPEDVIVAVDGVRIAGVPDLLALLSSMPAGHNAHLETVRAGQSIGINVVLAPRPYSEPSLSLVIQLQADTQGSERDRIDREMAELTARYQEQRRQVQTQDSLDALRELEIELTQLKVRLALLQRERSAETAAEGGVAASNVDNGIDGRGALLYGSVTFDAGFVGLDLTPQLAAHFGIERGVLVKSVIKGSPAEQAGLRAGDIIIGSETGTLLDTRAIKALFAQRKKQNVPLRIERERKQLTVVLAGIQQ
jgi:S1-C subfamily serine protease